jgi:hypothetical protein
VQNWVDKEVKYGQMTGVHQLPPQKWLEFAYNGLERFDINMVQRFVQNLDIYGDHDWLMVSSHQNGMF